MEQFFIPAAVLGSFLILVVPGQMRYYFTLALILFIILVTSIPAAIQFFSPLLTTEFRPGSEFTISLTSTNWTFKGYLGELRFTIDRLSSFFILITNFTVLTGILYSRGYLKAYANTKNPAQFALHNFSYIWLHFSMLAVLTLRDGLSFLIAWELMAVSSFMLILFEAEKRATLKTAVNYLVQMHIGFVLLLFAFLITESGTGQMSFDALPAYFSSHSNIGLFVLFFSGFAVKAGFMPFHTWLPEAHPAAPSHVSAVMSGVMIKMGIYGIFRVLTSIQSDWYTIGLVLLIISALTGILGILFSTVQKDLKKILAYSTIENIGIIGLGIGLGCIGMALHNPVIAVLGFTGSLLHVLNHSLFKSLLFYGAGSVYRATHTRNIEELGGLVHSLPRTAGLFLFGTVAICALPPLNGFISEFLLYAGFIKGLSSGNEYLSILFLLIILTLTLIGGMAIFSFSRAYGISFLGSPRKEIHVQPETITRDMILPQLLVAFIILGIGLMPMAAIAPIASLVANTFHPGPIPSNLFFTDVLNKLSLFGLLLISLVTVILLLRSRLLKNRKPEYGPTWGCGYTEGTARQQYTGASFSGNLSELAQPVLQNHEEFRPIATEDIFPKKRSLHLQTTDIFSKGLGMLTDLSWLVLKKLARLQTGNIRHYILYAFIFILLIFALLYLKLI
ncbi:MAG: proton-conducting transporter membrane subunit [Bacteroidetes bacterium]|nr:proton-conducting transporter membrane subunit [Bacteroidota bacterium]